MKLRPNSKVYARSTGMAGVVNDIEALAEFRAHLMQFNHDLAENFATIRGHWRELGEVWRDDMYQVFGEALEEVTPGITHYLSATEGHEAHLAALIEQLRGYLETGLGTGAGRAVSRRDRDPRRHRRPGRVACGADPVPLRPAGGGRPRRRRDRGDSGVPGGQGQPLASPAGAGPGRTRGLPGLLRGRGRRPGGLFGLRPGRRRGR